MEPPKKKLKQARLPFQTISPGVKTPATTTPKPVQRKRKPSETPGDVIIEVKENQVVPLEKKLKIVNTDEIKETKNINSRGDEKKVNDKCVEVEDEKLTEGKKSQYSKPFCKKEKNTPKNANRRRKNVQGQTRKKTNEAEQKTVILDVIDLSDSLSKSCDADEKFNEPKVLTKLETSTCKKNNIEVVQINKKKNVKSQLNKKTNVKSQINKKTNVKSHINMKTNVQSQINKEDEEGQVTQKREITSEENENLKPCDSESTKENNETEKQKDLKSDESMEEKNCSSNLKTSNKPINEHDKQTEALITVCKEKSFDNISPKEVNTVNCNKTINVNSSSQVETEEASHEKGNETVQSEKDSNSPSEPIKISITNSSQLPMDESPILPNKSLSTTSVSSSSDCDTPTSEKTKRNNSFQSPQLTPRRMTPKQLLKFKEKEQKQKEKEQLKQEKKKKKAEEQEEKLRLKQEKEEEKLKVKQEKEEEKRKEKEEKERKKQAELEQKNEEKRLKEEEKRAKEEQKNEEKRAREEEKRKKEEEENRKKEEKKLKEKHKLAEQRKSAQAFVNFFVKSETKTTNVDENKENEPIESTFQPFEVKNDMRLAPLWRDQLTEERKKVLDTIVECGTDEEKLYLEHLRCPEYLLGSSSRTWPPPHDTDDDVIIIESEQPNDMLQIQSEETEKKPEKKRQRAKLLQFHENQRPPYWGTWQKKSKFVTPRTPFNQDKVMFEYDVDSDDEWEEPEDGESLRGSEDEESQDEQYEEDNDMFVPHGYLSDEEGQDELDDKSPEAMKARLKFLQLEFEAERNEKQEKLKPRLIGCVWFCNSENDSAAIGSQIAELFLSRRAVWAGSLPLVTTPPPSSSPPSATASGDAEETKGAKKKSVHDSVIPHIIKKVHGNRTKLKKLMEELREELQEMNKRPSRRCLADKIREMASWSHSPELGHNCWYVKEEVRLAYGVTDLNVICPSTPPPTPTTNITKFTKVLTVDERLKLLRESPASSQKDGSKLNPDSTLLKSQPTSQRKSQNIKLNTPAKASPMVKKRATLLSVPQGQESHKQSPMTSFVQTVAKSVKSEDNINMPTTTEKTTANTAKSDDKLKKRITLTTLTTFVSKPTPPLPLEEEHIVLSD